MLWLALHLPLLPLEACRSSPEGSLAAVVARGRIVVASRAAAAAGVVPGLRLSGALGLAPGLAVFERDAGREAVALAGLACWAGRFTPQVSLSPPATLLLEIGGCLRLFGGLDRLHAAVRQGCAGQGFTVQTAVAPTALGATWLAWAGEGTVCLEPAALRRMLGALPCAVADWGESVHSRLQAFGLATLAEALALPQAELARRIGAGPVAELARAMGDLPDLRPWFAFPEKFSQGLELPAKVEAAEMLVFAGQRLLAALCGWLAVRGAGVAGCALRLLQEGGGMLEVPLRPAAATRDEGRLLLLLRERLNRLELAAPVLELELRADDVLSLPGESGQLFVGERSAGEGALASLERLRARLGEDCVFTLAACPDYRPECASGRAEPGGRQADPPPPAGPRPLWLLPQPRRLPEIGGRPHWEGELTLLAGPERLESGWWDEGEAVGDVRRDYLVAGNDHGQRLWIFRDAEGWFLHGLFA